MGYKYLDRYDIKLIEDNMHDLEDLLPVIDNLIGVERERAYTYGHDVGVDEGWCDCYDTYKEEIDGYDYAWE